MKNKKNLPAGRQGFTLLELLIVIVILGTLATFIIIRLTGGEKSARDARRRSDLRQYQTVIEAYKSSRDGYFPSRVSIQYVTQYLCLDFSLTVCPDDPQSPTSRYRYVTNGSGSAIINATDYLLWVKLEKPTVNTWFVVCSNGALGEVTVEPTTYTCPI